MLKKIKLPNSKLLFIGLLFIIIGFVIGFYESFLGKKNETFSEMNILLYDSEIPDSIYDIEEDINTVEDNNENVLEEENNSNETQEFNYDFIGYLEIPKINLKRGFVDQDSKYNSVNYNITIINGSTTPDIEKGNFILAAHSGNCNICYFDKLYKLDINDYAYIYYNNIKYTYKIVDIYYIEKNGKATIKRNSNFTTLTLITCTRNSNTEQTVYILQLESKN